MLKKIHRLPLRKTRLQIESRAQRLNTPLFALAYIATDQPTRFGFIISKKVSPLAVTRNKIRRHLSSAVSTLLPQLKPGFDIIIYPKSSITSASFDSLSQQLQESLKKIHVYQSTHS